MYQPKYTAGRLLIGRPEDQLKYVCRVTIEHEEEALVSFDLTLDAVERVSNALLVATSEHADVVIADLEKIFTGQ